jgi:hypothetical protein
MQFTRYSRKNRDGTLLSPSEFDYLRECWSTKEDNPKTSTKSCAWQASRIMDALPADFDLNPIVDREFSNFQIIGTPQFRMAGDDPDAATLDYELERTDLTQSWVRSQSRFRGSVRLSLGGPGRMLITSTHTAAETKAVAKQVTDYLLRHFGAMGYIAPQSKPRGVTFSAFNNERRIAFFITLTNSWRVRPLNFIEWVDSEIRPDDANPLPPEINWMEGKIRELRLKGRTINATPFFSNPVCHPHLALSRVDVKCGYALTSACGTCVLSIGFPGSESDSDAEMEITVESLTLDPECRNVDKNDVRRAILAEAENRKVALFEEMAETVGSVSSSPAPSPLRSPR